MNIYCCSGMCTPEKQRAHTCVIVKCVSIPANCSGGTAVTEKHTGVTVDESLISNQNKMPVQEKRLCFTATHSHTHCARFLMLRSASWALRGPAVADVESVFRVSHWAVAKGQGSHACAHTHAERRPWRRRRWLLLEMLKHFKEVCHLISAVIMTPRCLF